MGPLAPETKQAWKELNEHFGRCPKCGTDPFVGWDALSSHSSHMNAFLGIVISLVRADILMLSTQMSDILEGGRKLGEAKDSDDGLLQGLSEALINVHSDVSNVHIEDEKFECKECGVTWKPAKWDTSLTELGLTAAKY